MSTSRDNSSSNTVLENNYDKTLESPDSDISDFGISSELYSDKRRNSISEIISYKFITDEDRIKSIKLKIKITNWQVHFWKTPVKIKNYLDPENLNTLKVSKKAAKMWDYTIFAEEGTISYKEANENIREIAQLAVDQERWFSKKNNKDNYEAILKITKILK